MNSRPGRFGDVGVHSKKTELSDYKFLTSADEVKFCRLERREENEKEIGVMTRGTEKGDTDGLDRAESANDDAAEESNNENNPSNQHLSLPPSNFMYTRCALSQNTRGTETSNERLA